jgi:hypothetical protein
LISLHHFQESSLSLKSHSLFKTLRDFAAVVILFSGTVCVAGDEQAARSCHDNSMPAATRQTIAVETKDKSVSEPELKPHGIKLSWHASVPASTSSVDAVAGYNIFRRESGKDCQQPGNTCEKINEVLILGTSCTDYSVQPGHTYVYQAQAVSAGKVASKFSREARAVMPKFSNSPR